MISSSLLKTVFLVSSIYNLGWDFSASANDYLHSALESFSTLATLTVNSQGTQTGFSQYSSVKWYIIPFWADLGISNLIRIPKATHFTLPCLSFLTS